MAIINGNFKLLIFACCKYQLIHLIFAEGNDSFVEDFEVQPDNVTGAVFAWPMTSKPIWVSNQTKVNITYEKDQLGVMYLDCRLSAGNPLPIITWIKDGYIIDLRDEYSYLIYDNDTNNVQSHGAILLFARSAMEIQGKYSCFAENYYGRIRKTFWVTVEKSYLEYWLNVGAFGVFLLIMVGCACRVATLDKPIPHQTIYLTEITS